MSMIFLCTVLGEGLSFSATLLPYKLNYNADCVLALTPRLVAPEAYVPEV